MLRRDEKEFQVPSERKGISHASVISIASSVAEFVKKVPSGGGISGKLAAGSYRCSIRNWPTQWRNSRGCQLQIAEQLMRHLPGGQLTSSRQHLIEEHQASPWNMTKASLLYPKFTPPWTTFARDESVDCKKCRPPYYKELVDRKLQSSKKAQHK
ncbi:hypothetical protein T4E_11204 [Trichinella pseudospiralis]|uniref:Uncharacterized protein n=1 Tax=Trichinella pseudospiralis TaxID=6337 RepID=A0A0V1FQD4_TRIPS|nr:hypothetical protein T4E_11204 [Trichinella pseudospiralis]KRY88246.1 hypothetical protein T4D_7703 [Trichinella pseudospiralis]